MPRATHDGNEPTGREAQIIDHFERRLEAWAPICEEEHDRIEENEEFMFLAKAQWSDADRARNKRREQPSPSINAIAPVVNMVTGTEITGRLRARLFPRHPAQDRIVGIFDEALRMANDETDSEHEETMAFRQQFAHGLACCQTGWDRDEPAGMRMAVHNTPIYEMLWDVTARKGNLMDRIGHMHGRWISEDTYTELYSEIAQKVLANENISRDEAPSTSGSWTAVKDGFWHSTSDRMVFLIRYEWRERSAVYDTEWVDLTKIEELADQLRLEDIDEDAYRQQAEAVLAETELRTLEKGEFNRFRERYEEIIFGAENAELDNDDPEKLRFDAYNRRRPWRWHYAFIVGNEVHEHGLIRHERPSYNFITGIPVTTREKTRWIGMVDLMKDGQEWRNRAYLLALMMAAHAVKGGILYGKNQGLKADELRDKLAQPGFAIPMPPEFFDPKNRQFELVQPDTRSLQGISPLADIAEEATLTGVGLSKASLGWIPDVRRVSSLVVDSVKQSASLQLAIFFDGVRRFRKESSRVRLDLLLSYLSEEDLADLVGPDLAYDEVLDPQTGEPTGQYNLVIPPKEGWPEIRRIRLKVDEAPSGPTSQVEFFNNMMEHGLGLFYLQTGMIDPEMWVELHPPGWISPEMKKDWIDFLRKQKAAQAAQPQPGAEQQGGGQGAPPTPQPS